MPPRRTSADIGPPLRLCLSSTCGAPGRASGGKPGTLRRKGFFAAIAAVLALGAAVTAGAVPGAPPRKSAPAPPPARRGRALTVIDDAWTFHTDPEGKGAAEGWEKSPPAGRSAIALPGFWSSVAHGYSGAAWYWRELDPPGSWIGQTIRIQFGAVAEHAEVWLNGQKLGEHNDGVTPFTFDVTKTIRIGAKNLLAVRVEGTEEHGAGIWQGVLLMAHDEAYIADVFPYGGPVGNLRADIDMFNSSDKSGDADLEAKVVAAAGQAAEVKKSSQTLALTPKRNVTSMLINVPKKKVSPWSPQSPALFDLLLAFRQGPDVLDSIDTRFGFRELGWSNGAILLNGESFTPKALAPDLPRPVVIATEADRAQARSLLGRMKSAGVNVVYLEAPHPALLEVADETGMMVVESHRSRIEGEAGQAELLDLIRRDRAHPCILGWYVGGLGDGAVSAAQSLDPTRFVLRGSGAAATLYVPHGDGAGAAPPAGLLPR